MFLIFLYSFLFGMVKLSMSIQQPMFINAVRRTDGTVEQMRAVGNYQSDGDGDSLKTPLQKYKTEMLYHVGNLIERERGETAVQVLRTFIKVERASRLRLCFRFFGSDGCSKKRMIDPRPFFIWKKRLTYTLTRDPTTDVLTALRIGLN